MDFHMFNHPCIPGIKPTWSWRIFDLLCSWIQFARILLSIFASMFISEIGLKFSFLVGSLCGLGTRVIVASEDELGRVPSDPILWNSLESIGIMSSIIKLIKFCIEPIRTWAVFGWEAFDDCFYFSSCYWII